MLRFPPSRVLTFALAASALAACGGDDSTFIPADGSETGGDHGTEFVAPQMQALLPATVQAGQELMIPVTVANPSNAALTWSVTSSTIPDLATASTLVGSNTGAELRWTPAADQVGTHSFVFTAAWDPAALAAAWGTGVDPSTTRAVDITVEPEPCFYPSPTGFRRGVAFPDYAWDAVAGDGSPVELDMYDIYCDDTTFGAYDTIVFVISTVWCPNCPRYIAYVDALAERLEQEGALLVYLDVQDAQGGPVSTETANQHFNQYAANGSGYRAGDSDNVVEENGVLASPLIEYFPTSFVVRRRDMQVIADQRDTDYYLPLVEIAMDPEADWSSPPAPTIVPEFPSNCGEEDEEVYEPNNDVEAAAEIGEGSFDGGICGPNTDFYRVTVEGPWTIRVEFDGSEGDLDMQIVDASTGRALEGPDGNPLVSQSTGDLEELSYEGAATVVIYGYNDNTTTYTLSVTANAGE